MKLTVLVPVLCFCLLAGAQHKSKDRFILKGRISGIDEGWLYLYYQSATGTGVKDSTTIQKGRFSFTGTISEPVMAYLQLKEEKRNEKNTTGIFLEPAVMTLTLQLNNFGEAKCTGSKTQQEYETLNRSKEQVRKQMQPVIEEYNAANDRYFASVKNKQDDSIVDDLKEKAAAVREKFTPYNDQMNRIDLLFFNSHPQSSVTAYMLVFHVHSLPLDSLQLFYNRLGNQIQQTVLGKRLAKEIEELRSGSPGNMAKNFTTTDIMGDQLSLTDFKGKYVLLDFWASWCVPCRKGNPHLKELYAKYKDKGVEKDGLPWRQVLRGLDMKKRINMEPNDADINEKFGISVLPTKILIDPSGKIIGRIGEEEDKLDKMLAAIFE